MADLFDRFTGSAGDLLSHTSDSGDTWGPSGDTGRYALDGSGSLYLSGTYPGDSILPYSSWTPPGTDYSVKVVVGSQWRAIAAVCAIGPAARCSGALGSVISYSIQVFDGGSGSDVIYIDNSVYPSYFLIGPLTLASRVQTGDVIELQVSGTSTVTLTALINGTQVAQTTDTTAYRITTAGSASVRITGSGAGDTDIIRTLWAGAIGGPSEGVSPASASVPHNDTQSFSATGLLPNETAAWSTISGSVSPGSGSTTVYTAPASGSSDTVTWTSEDLPTHTASASILSTFVPWFVIENLAVGSPAPIQVTTPGASSGPRSVVVTGWPTSWTSFPMILTALRGGALLGNLEATAYDSGTQTLSISGVTGDYSDFALAAGDVFQNRVCVEVTRQVQSAIDSLASTLGMLGEINAQAGTSYTLVLSDAGKFVTLSNASATTLTVPPNSSVAFPAGAEINLAQVGAGQVTVAPGSGVTINSYLGHTNLAGQYANATLKRTAADTWLLVGNLA